MKKVLITGGATGIGKACAVKFKEKGYEVFITYNKTYHKHNNEVDMNHTIVDHS